MFKPTADIIGIIIDNKHVGELFFMEIVNLKDKFGVVMPEHKIDDKILLEILKERKTDLLVKVFGSYYQAPKGKHLIMADSMSVMNEPRVVMC